MMTAILKSIQFSVFVLANIVPSYSKEPQQVPPQLSIKSTNFNFGIIDQGVIVSNQFLIINSSGTNIGITKISRSCSCSFGRIEGNMISAGESRSFVVQYNSKGKKGFFDEQVILETDSKYHPQIVFGIKGWVAPKDEIIYSPKIVDFGCVESTNTFKSNIKLVAKKNLLTKLALKLSSKEIVLKNDGAIKNIDGFNNLAEASYTLALNASRLGRGYGSAYVEILGGHSSLRIPVEWHVSNQMIASPKMVLFGIVKKDAKSERLLKINGNNIYELKSGDSSMEISRLYHDNAEGVDLYKCTLYGKSIGNRELDGVIDIFKKQSGEKVDSVRYYGYLQSK